MADTFNNDLRVREQEAGSNSGTWGGLLNTTISNLASAFGQGSEAIPNASTHTITLADGAADEARSMYLKCTGGGQACTVTLAPNTISKVWIISNETSFTLTFSQGSGANVAVAAGAVKMIVTDGAGASGAVTDALSGLEGVFGTVTAAALTVDTDTLHVDATNNRIGIGTVSPKTTLNLAANNSGQGAVLTLENTDTSITTNDVLGQIDFYGNDGSTGGTGQKATIQAIAENGSGTSVGLIFGTSPFPNTAATERARIDASGNLILKKNLVLESTSEGIDFSGVGASSQTLDDYEEGTFTPTFASIGTGTFNVQLGTYVKIGNLVTVQCHLDISTVGSASGALQISGFPFPAENRANSYGISSTVHGTSWSTTRNSLNIILPPNATVTNGVYYDMAKSGPVMNATHADMGQGNLLFSMTYRTT